MLDEHIDSLNSENLTEDPTSNSNSEADNSELKEGNSINTDSKEEVTTDTESASDSGAQKNTKESIKPVKKVLHKK